MRVLLDFIAKHESQNSYNAVWGRISAKDRPPKRLTTMTIGEVLAWQDRIDPHYLSEAAGAYQMLEDTLRGLYRSAGLSEDDLFDEKNQDALAVTLLKRRGLNDWRNEQISTVKFANNLAKEWASLPVVSGPKQGRSYYDGDGLNSALTTPKEFLAVLDKVRNPTKPKSNWAAFIAAILRFLQSIFKRKAT